ncbi:hypothetical protein L596_017576 [Steinernema carpocapsae]|uniref:Uncharacterized protein n=1 Tax=Steinernema carpocapsae TaxID=34508 RepID=A0A4U5N2B7_STECR|nr:hypothetical protein L596_017576 [Steinernema carpocapsae]
MVSSTTDRREISFLSKGSHFPGRGPTSKGTSRFMVAGRPTESAPCPLQGGLSPSSLPRSARIRLQFQKINSHTSDKYFVVCYP